jgi:hypothetical protein
LEYNLPQPNILTCFEAADALEGPDYSGQWTPGMEWEDPPVVPTVEDWQPYRDVLDEIYNEIWKLREGRPRFSERMTSTTGSSLGGERWGSSQSARPTGRSRCR